MASTEDRIAQWKARRQAGQAAKSVHADLPTRLALIAAQAEALGTGEDANPEPVLALVLGTLRSEPAVTVAERRALYDAIARGLEHAIAEGDTLSEFAELRRRQLRAVVRAIEADIRLGQTTGDPAYRPGGIEEALASLQGGYERRRRLANAAEVSRQRRLSVLADEAYAIAVTPEEEADLVLLREALARIDAARLARHPRHESHPNLRAWAALLRYQLTLLASESRVALVWNLVGPAVLLGLIATGYYLSGITSVLNMDVPTFAMTGATTWLMFRNVIFRSTAAFHAHRWLLNLRPFSPTMVGLSQGLLIMGSYVGVFLTLIGVGHLAGLFTLPWQPVLFAFWVACVGVAGLALGVAFGTLAVVWRYSPRFAPVIERFLQVFSSVILVSEQLPEAWRPWALWSPLAHALQLIRQAYFAGYHSDDASAAYFFVGLGLVVVLAGAAQRAVRSRSVPM